MIRKIIKKILPPIVLDVRHMLLRTAEKDRAKKIHWHGDYASWEDARKDSSGYEADIILKKTSESILKVKRGEAVYERDSVLFDKPDYSWPLLAIMLRLASENGNKLNIADFGGSLGSSYFQSRKFLAKIDLQWSVIEQEHYIAYGNERIADDKLKFYFTIDDCIAERKPSILLLSGVVQCLDEPYKWIEKFTSYGFDYILIDRTAFINRENDRLTVQEVPESTYRASYPTWFFNQEKFVEAFHGKYIVTEEFDSHPGFLIPFEGLSVGFYKGMLLKKRG